MKTLFSVKPSIKKVFKKRNTVEEIFEAETMLEERLRNYLKMIRRMSDEEVEEYIEARRRMGI